MVSSQPKVGVVVLNHNGKELTEACLRSVFEAGYPNKDVILVDNASTDGSIEYVQTRFPEVEIIANVENLGVASGRNTGFREAVRRRNDYILSLDNDAVIDPKLIDILVETANADARIGVVGPKTYEAGQSHVIQCAGGHITYTQNVCAQRGAGEIDQGQYDLMEEVDYFPGFGFMARREVFEQLNFVDEQFYGYGHEDTDFCLRASRLGYRVVYAPQAVMWHCGSATIGEYTPRKKYLEAVNSVYFVRKYGRPQDRIKYACVAGLGLAYALVVQGMRGNHKAVIAKARGMLHGLGKPIAQD